MQKQMGTWERGGARSPKPLRWGRFVLPLLAAAVAILVIAPAARATFHLVSIREVYPASAAAPQSSYVELQTYAGEQNFVAGHAVKLYNATGGLIGTFSFGSNLPGNGANQQTMLVGDDGVQAAFGVTPDLVSSSFNVPAAGGAACWAETIDCVSWGSFSGSLPSAAGTPADGGGIPNGMALRRTISAGTCTNLLDSADDTNDSATDLTDAAPGPVSYATVPAPTSCSPVSPPPSAIIDTKPPSATNSIAATFTFHSNPVGAGFECRLDVESFEDCDSGTVTYDGPLTEATHSFQVRASNANGTGAATTYSWKVDLTPPTATITSHPVDPSPGTTASFKYSSNESGSKFECRLTPGEASFAACSGQPKVYSNLADGDYVFAVRAIDAAGNAQSIATSFAWTVDNSLTDMTPPETAIVSKPSNPSSSPNASFTYSSSEPGSSFECKLDGGGFAGCASTGIAYANLGSGSHTFQVRAIDPDENVDPSPAGYTFDVVLPAAGSPLAPVAPVRSAPALPPQTTIGAKPPAKTRDRTPTFRFRSTGSGATFQCKVDGTAFKPCRSPFTTKSLSFGRHTVQIRAVVGGLADPTPAAYSFKVVKRR